MCKKSLFLSLCITILLVLTAFPAIADPDKEVWVVELYTSQGCPACPRGDAIFGELANNRKIIGLGCHVTYFDRSAKDDMSRIFCDARQTAYKESGTTNRVYTPQIVINGQAEAVANNKPNVQQAFSRTTAVRPLDVELRGSYVHISLPNMKLYQNVDVWLFAYDDSRTANIKAGADRGKPMSYARPVTNLTKLLSWDGKPTSMSFPVSNFSGDNYAVIAQYRDAAIIAAGKTD